MITSLFGSFKSLMMDASVYDSSRKAASSWGSTECPNVIVKTCAPSSAMRLASVSVAGLMMTSL